MLLKKILVTGAAGFIGYHLIKSLLKLEHIEVVGIDNINDYYDVNLKYDRLTNLGIVKDEIYWFKRVSSIINKGFSFYRINLEDKIELMSLCQQEKFEIVVNLAAQAGVRYSIENPDAYIQSNVVGFLNILEICRNFSVKHLVYASSSSVYGMNEKMPFSVEDNVDHPISLYAATKKSNELMAHTYSHLYGIPTTGLRFFTVYGPWGRPDMAYFLFTDAILKGKEIKVFNNGKLKRDFTYVDDIVNGIQNIIFNVPLASDDPILNENPGTSKAPYRLYNLGNNSPVELMDFISTISTELDLEPKLRILDMQPGDVISTWANIDDVISQFNYNPTTNIKLGLKKFIEWYKNYYQGKC